MNARTRAAVLASCLLTLNQGGLGHAAGNECASIPGLRCQGDMVERPVNTGTVVLKGKAEASFPGFHIRAERIEVTHNPKGQTKRVLVMAEGDVVLQQSKQELRFRSLTFESDLTP